MESLLSTGRLGEAYLPRIVDAELDELLAELSAVAIEGPRGVGKTATALQRARTVFRLDDPAQAAIVAADPTRIVRAEPPVLIDEWQVVPQSWDLVRRAVDAGAAAGTFILTGSAAPVRAPTHTGAGRIVTGNRGVWAAGSEKLRFRAAFLLSCARPRWKAVVSLVTGRETA